MSILLLSEIDMKICECADGFLQDQNARMLWINRLAMLINDTLGRSPRIRLGGYRATTAYATLDCFASSSDEKYVAITIHQSHSVIALPKEFNSQLDIELPGIIDTLTFLDLLLKKTGGTFILANLANAS